MGIFSHQKIFYQNGNCFQNCITFVSANKLAVMKKAIFTSLLLTIGIITFAQDFGITAISGQCSFSPTFFNSTGATGQGQTVGAYFIKHYRHRFYVSTGFNITSLNNPAIKTGNFTFFEIPFTLNKDIELSQKRHLYLNVGAGIILNNLGDAETTHIRRQRTTPSQTKMKEGYTAHAQIIKPISSNLAIAVGPSVKLYQNNDPTGNCATYYGLKVDLRRTK